jgi:hypothetical protein
VTASSRRRPHATAVRAALAAWAAALFGTACAELPPAPVSAAAAARTAPDDSDAWNLVPATAASLADLDLVKLRASAWSRDLVTGGFAEDREARLSTFGFDVFKDGDRMVVAAIDVSGLSRQMTVVAGRFEIERVAAAFVAASPGASETRWRDCRVWEAPARGGGEKDEGQPRRALALVGRTLVQGTPETVRASIDAAWGILPDARSGPLGALRRDLEAEERPPAASLAVIVTDEIRARAREVLELPPGISRVGARLDLAVDLEGTVVAVFEDPTRARAAARQWEGDVRDLARNRALRVMGLGPVFEGASLAAEGARVHGRLHIPESRREAMAERVLLLLQALARERGQGGAQP